MSWQTPNLIYFVKPVGLDGPVKIGCSHLPADRLMTLAAWSPFPLELIGTAPGGYQQEDFLHRCFANSHSHREWFHSTPDLHAAIKKIVASGSVEAIKDDVQPAASIRKKRTRRTRTEIERLLLSYRTRIRHTERRLRKVGENTNWHCPSDVTSILSRWSGYVYWNGSAYVKVDPVAPSAAEMKRLEEYLAAPEKHSVLPSWQIPKDPILIPHIVEDAPSPSALIPDADSAAATHDVPPLVGAAADSLTRAQP